MKGLLTRSSEREIQEIVGFEFLEDLKLTVKNFCEKETCKGEVIHALIHNEYVSESLASDFEKIVSFEVEAIVGDTIVLTYIGLAS